jgi:hypothetical protein
MLLIYPNLLRCYSVRPIFLGCCVLAVKVSREGGPSLSYLLSRVQDVFNLLDVRLLSRIEHQLLEVLSSQPAPTAPQPRPRISLPHSMCAPMRCAGAGLADAHGRRAISSLRRCALRRGCGRAPRAAHAGPTDPRAVGPAGGPTRAPEYIRGDPRDRRGAAPTIPGS